MVRDIISHIKKLILNNGIRRIEWYAFADNPAIKGYEKIIKRFGGHRVGVLHKCNMLRDGKLHDSIMYEILIEEA
jgi:RimJ/RimL family protein N-acetyltransferase